jgi:hypothetical protein
MVYSFALFIDISNKNPTYFLFKITFPRNFLIFFVIFTIFDIYVYTAILNKQKNQEKREKYE